MSNHPDFKRHPDAVQIEQAVGFDMPWSFQYLNVLKLQNRAFEHTRWTNLVTLEKFDMAEEFLELTQRIGITPAFWQHRELAYQKMTLEFLSSLVLMQENGQDIILFRLVNSSHKARLGDVAEVFGLERNCPVDRLPFTKDLTAGMVWIYLAGHNCNRRSRLVQHPTLRILMRAYASQIFCRGETANITNDREIGLMWQTLQPNPIKVNVIKLMVEYWIYQRDRVPKGSITMGGFVSVLAKCMQIPLLQRSSCTGFSLYTAEWYRHAHFLLIERDDDGVERYLWQREQGSSFYLPYPHRVNLDRPDLWIIPADYSHALVRRHSIAEGRDRGQSSNVAIEARVGSHSPPTHYGRDSSHMPSWAKKLTKMVSKLTKIAPKTSKTVKRVKREQGRLSSEIERQNRRLDNVTNIVYDNDFYNRYGYWPGGEDDPNMQEDEQAYSAGSSHAQPTFVPSHQSVGMLDQPLANLLQPAGGSVASPSSVGTIDQPIAAFRHPAVHQEQPQPESQPPWHSFYGVPAHPPTLPHPWSEYPPPPQQADSDPNRYQHLAPQQPAEFDDPFGIFPTYSLQ